MRRLRVLTACIAGATAVTAAAGDASVEQPTATVRAGSRGALQSARRRLFSDSELDAFADEVKRTGSVLLKGVLDPTKLKEIRKVYSTVLAARIERAGPDRGPSRYYATPPFVMPFADPDIFQQPDIIGLVWRLVGDDPVLCQWAGDTPMGVNHSDPRLPGPSEYQDVHRDAAPLYPVGAPHAFWSTDSYRWHVDEPDFPELPTTQLAVNFPLVDVLPTTDSTPTNGPTEFIYGTHRLSVSEGQALIAAGNLDLQPVYMTLGDVLVRDVRGLHRGTPNLSTEPREMIVVGYSRAWLRRPEVGIEIRRSDYEALDVEGQSLLRFERIVDDNQFSGSTKPPFGEGWSPVYDSATLEKASGASYKSKEGREEL